MQTIGLEEWEGLDCRVHPNHELADDDRCASVIFNHLFDERAYLVVWRGAVGDDACADFKAQADGLTWFESHDLIANLDFHWTTGIVAEAEFHCARLRLGEHRVNGGRNACWCGIDGRNCKKRRGDDCDGETIETFHLLAPDSSSFDGSFLPWYRKARRAKRYARCSRIVPQKKEFEV